MATTVTVAKSIAAPVEVVFRAVANVEQLPETNPDVVGVEFLTDQRRGAGTRFRETRRMKNKSVVTELEIVDQIDNERVRMVTDSHGTVWDTVFVVRPVDGGTELTVTMDARPHALLPKLLNPLMKGMFTRGIASHLDVVGTWCESQTRA